MTPERLLLETDFQRCYWKIAMSFLSRALPVMAVLLLILCSRFAIAATDLPTDPAPRAAALIDRGETLRLQGRLSQASADLEEAWRLAQASPDPALRARAAGAIGALYLFQQRLADAETLLRRSLEEAQTAQLPAVAAAAHNHLGLLQAGREEPDQARAERQRWLVRGSSTVTTPQEKVQGQSLARADYEKGLALAQLANDPEVGAALYLNLARLDAGSVALRHLQAAHTQAQRIAAPANRIVQFVAISRHAPSLTGLNKAETGQALRLSYTTLREAAAQAATLDNQRLRSLVDGQLGALYESQHRFREAITLTERAAHAADAIDATDLRLRWQWQLGRLRRADGDPKGALVAYRQAIQHLQTLRFDIPVRYVGGRSSFRETLEPVYLGAVDLLLEQSAREPDSTHAQALLREARDTVERLKAAELNDYFQDPCAASPVATAELDRVAPHTAVLYPILLPDRLELLVSLSDGQRRVAIPVPAATVRQTAQELAQRLRPADDALQDYAQPSAQLYQWLIAPIDGWLTERKVDTLIFVPDGPLRLIPLAALTNGQQFVLERYAVVTAPGMSLVDPRPLPRQELRSLLAGISESVEGFPALPGVKSEIQHLQTVLPTQQTLMNQGFIRARFQEEVRETPYRVVHIASHGEFGGTPEKSFVLAYDGRLDMNQLEELMQAQAGETPIELLTLSACQTAEGDDRAPLGLGGVALKAGARSAVGSLWMVSDQAAQALIPAFYQQLQKPEVTKAKALQQAQLRLLKQPDLAHPFFWAPFILIGNWL
ncbi:MAG TPA: hypothetical protein DCS21_06880 [Gammaproteobacteria bacterium]|nr:hypothetical protein [Gammaproteobacteria bacterium]